MMQQHIIQNNIKLKISRISPGKYSFGSKNIMAKIVNMKCVIRVGGGYMGADEFIQTYGPKEIVMLIDAEQNKNTEVKREVSPFYQTR